MLDLQERFEVSRAAVGGGGGKVEGGTWRQGKPEQLWRYSGGAVTEWRDAVLDLEERLDFARAAAVGGRQWQRAPRLLNY